MDENDILSALHEGIQEVLPWETFLIRLRRRVQADRATLYMLWTQARQGVGAAITARADRSGAEMQDAGPASTILLASRLRPNRIYTAQDIAEVSGDVAAIVAPDAQARLMRVVIPAIEAWLVVDSASHDFSAAVSARLSGLAPHIAIALRNFSVLEQGRIRIAANAKIAAMRRQGWFLLTSDGVIFDRDAEGERHLHRGSTIYAGSDGRLHVRAKRTDHRLADIIRSFAHGTATAPEVMRISDTPDVDLLIQAFTPGSEAGFGGASLIVHVREAEAEPCDRSRHLGALLGLTPREAQLAQAIASGRGIRAAADALGLRFETARTYAKTIYSKTGARGQAQLTRMVQEGIALGE